MVIGIVEVELYIPHSTSLKDKRSVLNGLKDRLRKTFNISVAETDKLDKWQSATLTFVTVSNETSRVNSTLSKLIEDIERNGIVQVSNYSMQLL